MLREPFRKIYHGTVMLEIRKTAPVMVITRTRVHIVERATSLTVEGGAEE